MNSKVLSTVWNPTWDRVVIQSPEVWHFVRAGAWGNQRLRVGYDTWFQILGEVNR